MLLEGSLGVPLSEVMMHLPNQLAASAVEEQLAMTFPIFSVARGKLVVLVNSHELIMTEDSFKRLLLLDQIPTGPSKTASRDKVNTCSTSTTPSQPGRPSLISKFPSIVSVATSFIKANGFSAHERRREQVGKVGVSLREIREHLLATVTGLRSHRRSVSSVARLMQPPQCGTIASSRYKGLVAARVPGKRNQFREDHKDQHYLFAQVAYRREFTVCFDSECAIFSCDDMNKVKVGALAVSRYHQLQRFFPTDDAPNVPDHDFPIPGYLIIPSGYMRLRSNAFVANAEGEDLTIFRDEGLNDGCSVSVDTTAHFLAGSTSIPTCSPVATTVTTTTTMGANTLVSVRVENRDMNTEPTTLRVEVCRENTMQEITVSTSSTAPSQTTAKDSLNRPHFKVPHTGPTTVCLRSARFHSSTCETHMHDLKPVVEAVVSEGRTVITLIVDGGPDWSTNSLLNAMSFLRLWKSCNLDILCVTSFAARYSAYNPIEHLWSVLSKKLASVKLSAVADGDAKAPYYLSGITEEQKKAKEAEVFDRAITEISDVHWNKTVFDGFPVVPVPVQVSALSLVNTGQQLT